MGLHFITVAEIKFYGSAVGIQGGKKGTLVFKIKTGVDAEKLMSLFSHETLDSLSFYPLIPSRIQALFEEYKIRDMAVIAQVEEESLLKRGKQSKQGKPKPTRRRSKPSSQEHRPQSDTYQSKRNETPKTEKDVKQVSKPSKPNPYNNTDKVESEEASGYMKIKGAIAFKIFYDEVLRKYSTKEVKYSRLQFGMKRGSRRVIFSNWNPFSKKSFELGIVLGEITFDVDETKLPSNLKAEDIKEAKIRSYVLYAADSNAEDPENAPPSLYQEPIGKDTPYHPVLFYCGLVAIAAVLAAKHYDVSIPFFRDIDSALVGAVIIAVLGLTRLAYKKLNFITAIGVIITATGALGYWRDWDLPFIGTNYESLMIGGVAIAVFGAFPVILAFIALIYGLFTLASALMIGNELGWGEVPIGNWLLPALAFLSAYLLNWRQKRLKKKW